MSLTGGAPEFVLPPPTGPYRRLNPTTKLLIAVAEALIAFGVRGWTGPLLVLAAVAASALRAGVGRSLLPFLVATIPLVASILLVNTFLYAGATDRIVVIGPLAPTWTGLSFAVQATLRVVAFAMSAAVLGLTTAPDELVADLERRGMGRRTAFVLGATVRSVPRIIERVREITEAQRARGLDTEGRIWRRVRGLVPLAGPLIFGALTDVEEQTMALEARGFSAPSRRAVIRALPDSTAQRGLRWALTAGTLVLLVGSITGLLGFVP
ncbi:MAG TPA: energy-coupling factor transporter transmembrane component T [Candidatus Saccharimonadales bacterium]|nr:energy-coupling factor transporter transmembrane component T [Candidatus Saccharimonadales bacterium]